MLSYVSNNNFILIIRMLQTQPSQRCHTEGRVEEELMRMLMRLSDKKSAKPFQRFPRLQLSRQKLKAIGQPIDLTTIAQNLQQGKYLQANDVRVQLSKMISKYLTCYSQEPLIVGTLRIFESCIEGQWYNFTLKLKQKGIPLNCPIKITREVARTLQNLESLEQEKSARSLSGYQQLQVSRVQSEAVQQPYPTRYYRQDEYRLQEAKGDGFYGLSVLEKRQRMKIVIDERELNDQFEEVCIEKVDKYRKIIKDSCADIIDQLQRVDSCGLEVPKYLLKIYNQHRGQNLIDIFLFVRGVAYWVKHFINRLQYRMKQKCITKCLKVLKCIEKVLRYDRIVRKPTQTSEPFNPSSQELYSDSCSMHTPLPWSNRNQAEMKQLKKRILEDVNQHKKRDGLVLTPQKKRSRGSKRVVKSQERRNPEQLQAQRKSDLQFLEEYRKRNIIGIMQKYTDRFKIDWNEQSESPEESQKPISFVIPLNTTE